MKKLFVLFAALLLTAALHGQNPCGIVITGDFDSQCLYAFKDEPFDEYPAFLVACENTRVTYTANVPPSLAVLSCTWEVTGDVSHSASGNQLVVDWGNGGWGLLVVTVVVTDGTTTMNCTTSAYVKLMATPTAAAATVPAYAVDANGEKVIRVCLHGRVEFIDQSSDSGSDIAGYHWECSQAAPAATPGYVIDDVVIDDVVTHRVYNNCGCYDEEKYHIEVLEGEPLVLECYGTVCEGAVVTYAVASPSCDDYYWHVDGGTLLAGQHGDSPTVQWDRPRDGYGVLSLDGVLCGSEVCPAMLSVKVPVIQDSLVIEGPRDVCLGESAVYRLPLFGSTRYDWEVPPPAVTESDMEHGNEMRVTFPVVGTYHIRVRYRCDFLDCGPYNTEELIVTVRPNLSIVGQEQICTANSCDLHTEPLVSATWRAYDLGNGNLPVGTAVTGSAYSETFSPGRYLVTAGHPGCCGPATFVLIVKDVPPAPSASDLSPDNLDTACRHGGITLVGTPSEPHYSLVWVPACTTAAPQLYVGDSVNISYQDEVCDVWVYNYDRLLQCQSAGYYVHTVTELVPLPTLLPPTAITVCPNSIVSLHNMVPDQSRVGMLYEWKIETGKQHCVSVVGSHQTPDVTLLVNNITVPETLYIELTRSYCDNLSVTDRVTIIVRDNLTASLGISGPTDVCIGTEKYYTGTGCNNGTCSWVIENTQYSENPVGYTFNQTGTYNVTFRCNPYDYCTNDAYLVKTSIPVTVHPGFYIQGIVYDPVSQMLVLQPDLCGLNGYTFAWYYESTSPSISSLPYATTCSVPLGAAGYYTCVVTDPYGCTATATYTDPPEPPCTGITLSVGSIDYCDRTVQVTSPQYSTNVSWTVRGVGNSSIVTSGTNNSVADITVDEVGNYTVTAKVGHGMNLCYEGTANFTLDFKHDITLSAECGVLVIHNRSNYLDATKTVYVRIVDNDASTYVDVSFPVAQEYYYHTPLVPLSSATSYTVWLTGFGTPGNISNCPVGTIIVQPPTTGLVNVYTSNPYDSYPNYTTCDNTPVHLTATLNNPDVTIVFSNWSFGDGSSYQIDGNGVYHTFKRSTIPYGVNVTVTDSRGCVHHSSAINITSHQDNLVNGKLEAYNSLFCPHLTPAPQEIHFTIHNNYNHYDWSPLLSGTSYQNYVSEPDIYRVSVVNDNFCHKEGATYVPFSPCPTARIYAENFNCCEGQPLRLYGSLEPAPDIQYMWHINSTPPGYNQTFNTGDIVFTPPAAGTYNVSLTVTDHGSTCSSTAHATVTANSRPAAPVLSFVGNPCISDAPVSLTATGYSGGLHWGNGTTGATALYFTPGLATAYYYDPAIGCPSQEGTLRIHHQPDFDALLTGCYEKCQEYLLNNPLPVYSLTPDIINWQWYYNNSILSSANNDVMSLNLPFVRPGVYHLEVDYQNGACHAVSPNLTITEKTVCDCDSIQIDNMQVTTDVVDCRVHYHLTFDVCNDNDNQFCIGRVKVLSDDGNVQISADGCSGNYVAANDCGTFSLTLEVTGLVPSSVLLQMYDDECLHCTKLFSVDLKEAVECESDITDASIDPDLSLTNEAAVYCEFGASLPTGCTLLAVWSEPEMVVDYTYDPVTGDLDGLSMYNRAELTRIAADKGSICIRALLCCNDDLCIYNYCIKADGIFEFLERSASDSTADNDKQYASRPKGLSRDKLALAGNPTTGEVGVVGTLDDILEVLVMDMHGRHMARHEGVATFSVATLPAGTYIVRVTTQAADGSPARHHYLKLVKK